MRRLAVLLVLTASCGDPKDPTTTLSPAPSAPAARKPGGDSPAAAFKRAQEACEAKDWGGYYDCADPEGAIVKCCG